MFLLVCFSFVRVHENAIYNFPQNRISAQIWMGFTGSKLRCHLNTPVTHWGVVIVRKYGSPQSPLMNRTHLCGPQTTSPVFPGWGPRAGRCPVPSHTSHMTPALKVTHTQPLQCGVWGWASLTSPSCPAGNPGPLISHQTSDSSDRCSSGKHTLSPKHHCFLLNTIHLLNYFPSLKIPASSIS